MFELRIGLSILLPFEIEEGRWKGIPRAERLCKLGCGVVGDLAHFLNGCVALATTGIASLNRYNIEVNGKTESCFWRTKANELERRWRERVCATRSPQAGPENPADAQDDAVNQTVGDILAQHAEQEK